MKKATILYAVMFFIFGAVSCTKDEKGKEPEPPKIHELKIEGETLAILEGETKEVKITSGNVPYKVSADNDNVTATIKDNVVTVTGQKSGESTLTITDSKDKKATVKVTITAFVLDKTEVSVAVGETAMVTAQSGSGTYKSVSSDEQILTVAVSGSEITLTPLAKGQVTVTVTDTKTSKELTVAVKVFVKVPEDQYELSTDGTTLVRWLNDDVTEVDMQSDPILSQVTNIGRRAFSTKTSLASIVLPEGLKTIGEEAFRACRSLTNIVIPQGVTSIGDGAFQSCRGLVSITLPEALTELGEYAFSECNALTSIAVPNGVKTFAEGLFNKCNSLETITFSNELTTIGDLVFNGCTKLRNITLPNTVTQIGTSAFADCKALTEITIPSGVKELSSLIFSGCSELANITLGEGITKIRNAVFDKCNKLTEITIPAAVTEFGDNIFRNCTELRILTLKSTTPPYLWDYLFFYDDGAKNPLQHIYVPAGSEATYKSHEGWSIYKDKISVR